MLGNDTGNPCRTKQCVSVYLLFFKMCIWLMYKSSMMQGKEKIIQCCKYYDTWLKSIPYRIHEILLWCQSDTFSGQIFWVCIFTVKNQYKHFSWNISVLGKLMFTYLIVSVTWGIASVNVSSKFILLRGWDW